MIEAVSYRPFEAERRIFVIEMAETMAEESQNALLKTLEEPPAFAHLILISSQPGALLETVRSRCQEIRFAALSPRPWRSAWRRSRSHAPAEELRAAARLGAGDAERAGSAAQRARAASFASAAEEMVRAAIEAELGAAPWKRCSRPPRRRRARGRGAPQPLERAGRAGGRSRRPSRESGFARDAEEAAKRATGEAGCVALDTGLG